MSFTYWPKALAAGAQLRTYARVERVETDDAGRATGVSYVDIMSGQRFFQPAKVVVLAANGVGTPRLMLLSESNRFPNGLANGNDLVGRHLMHHGLAIVEGWVDDITDPHKGVESAVHICSEFAETDVSRGFINGFTHAHRAHERRGIPGAGIAFALPDSVGQGASRRLPQAIRAWHQRGLHGGRSAAAGEPGDALGDHDRFERPARAEDLVSPASERPAHDGFRDRSRGRSGAGVRRLGYRRSTAGIGSASTTRRRPSISMAPAVWESIRKRR